MQIVTPFVSASHVPARNTPTATKRKTNSQHPRHSDTGNKSSLFRVARRCAGQWGLVGHGDRALAGAEDRVAVAGRGFHGPAVEPEAGPALHLAVGAVERPGGESAPLPGLSTGLPWLYFLCRAVSVWFPRRRNSINPTPKSVNAANATVGADTPVLASWRIVFTMAGVAGGM